MNYTALTAWRGFKPLAQFNSKRASHARVLILLYMSQRSASGYFWGEIQTIADDVVLTRGEAGRLVKDLEAVGAVELTPHKDIPPHIKTLIETEYTLPPNKKVWRITGFFTIAEAVYWYEWTGDGGANVGKVNIPNGDNPNSSLSEHNRVQSKDLIEPNLVTRTTVKRKSDAWQAIEAVVKTDIFGIESIGIMGGTICDYLWLRGATPARVVEFRRWYFNQGNNQMVWQITRQKGTDHFDGKFTVWWQKFEEAQRPAQDASGQVRVQDTDGQILTFAQGDPRIQTFLDRGAEVLS